MPDHCRYYTLHATVVIYNQPATHPPYVSLTNRTYTAVVSMALSLLLIYYNPDNIRQADHHIMHARTQCQRTLDAIKFQVGGRISDAGVHSIMGSPHDRMPYIRFSLISLVYNSSSVSERVVSESHIINRRKAIRPKCQRNKT